MLQFLQDNLLSIISTLFGSGSFLLYFFERKKNQALTSQEIARADQEVSKAAQDKITTAERTIVLLDRVRELMDVENQKLMDKMHKMEIEIERLNETLLKYTLQCDKCANNKLIKK